jgi:rhamnogalacturonyl hydrolase YesR
MRDLPVLCDHQDEMAIAYVPEQARTPVLNNMTLSGAFLVKLWRETGNAEMLSTANKLLNFTVKRRTAYGAWYYTHPPNMSLLKHDNYHTGGILDGLMEYFEETNDDRYLSVYWAGLSYYHRYLFEEDGAPRWMNDRPYPYDIHGAAQGIVTFAKAGHHKPIFLADANKIAEWTINNLYRPRTKDFAYRQGRFVRWNYSLMRWCNAWMCRALAEMLVSC